MEPRISRGARAHHPHKDSARRLMGLPDFNRAPGSPRPRDILVERLRDPLEEALPLRERERLAERPAIPQPIGRLVKEAPPPLLPGRHRLGLLSVPLLDGLQVPRLHVVDLHEPIPRHTEPDVPGIAGEALDGGVSPRGRAPPLLSLFLLP